jgi:hypothetical protein
MPWINMMRILSQDFFSMETSFYHAVFALRLPSSLAEIFSELY